MGRLNKSVVALTFKFDCDRFLRYRLATAGEKKAGVPDANEARRSRPGINLVTGQGRAWEAKCYDDIAKLAKSRAAWALTQEVDEDLHRTTYAPLTKLAALLRKPLPPEFLIEAEFPIPGSLSPALKAALASGAVEEATARPDLLWVRPFDGSVALIEPTATPKFVVHVIDVKLAAEPSLRHFVEVTFYAFGLQRWFEENGLSNTFGVCAEGRVWPGTHNANAFSELHSSAVASGELDPLAHALLETTKPVPYEVYRPRLRQFLEERLPRVLALKPAQAPWHVGEKCQLCDFFVHCRDEALTPDVDHLSQMPDLTAGQAQVLRSSGITTFTELTDGVGHNSSAWQVAKTQSHRLKALERAFLARSNAFSSKSAVPIDGRNTVAMPRFTHASIYLTAHFDPGTGITFAFGARRVYFRTRGAKPEVTDFVGLVDNVGDGMSPRSERERLLELCRKLQEWLTELDNTNKLFDDDNDRQTVQFYVWNSLESRQLARVVARHFEHEGVAEAAAFLMRVFPLEGDLQSPQDYRTQPVTQVKTVVQNLTALPVLFAYTLWDAKNWLDPFINEAGKHIWVRPPYGFYTDLSDQIPFERAYELWQDRVMLRKSSLTTGLSKGAPLTRDELSTELRRVVTMHLSATNDVVIALQKAYREQLHLRKEPFSLKPPKNFNLPIASGQMVAFSQLNALADDLENMNVLAMPPEEREANFHSIRGLNPAGSLPRAKELITEAGQDVRYKSKIEKGWAKLYAFEFSGESRDTRIREGEFTLVLRNEGREHLVDSKWYRAAGHQDPFEAETAGARVVDMLRYASVRSVSEVTIVRLDTLHNPPLVVLSIDSSRESLCSSSGLRDLKKPLIIDPVAADFSTKILEKAIRRVGGKRPAKARR